MGNGNGMKRDLNEEASRTPKQRQQQSAAFRHVLTSKGTSGLFHLTRA